MNNKIRSQIHHFEDADDYIVKAKLRELDVIKGWDKIPYPYAAASILSYRGNDIWLFKYNPSWEEGWQYDMTVFRNYKDFPELEELAWSVIQKEGAIERLPVELNYN